MICKQNTHHFKWQIQTNLSGNDDKIWQMCASKNFSPSCKSMFCRHQRRSLHHRVVNVRMHATCVVCQHQTTLHVNTTTYTGSL